MQDPDRGRRGSTASASPTQVRGRAAASSRLLQTRPRENPLRRDQAAQPNATSPLHTRFSEPAGTVLHIFPCICTQLTLGLSDMALGAEGHAPSLFPAPGWNAILFMHIHILKVLAKINLSKHCTMQITGSIREMKPIIHNPSACSEV